MFLLTHKCLVPGASGCVLAYLGSSLLFGGGKAAGARALGTLLLVSAVNMLASTAWYASYTPAAGTTSWAIAIASRYGVLLWLVAFSYYFVADDRPRERRWALGVVALAIAPYVVAALSRIGESGGVYAFGRPSFWPGTPRGLAAAIYSVAQPWYANYVFLVGYAWALSVLARKCVRLERRADERFGPEHTAPATRGAREVERRFGPSAALRSLVWTRSRDARAVRAFGLVCLALLAVEFCNVFWRIPLATVLVLFISCAVVWVYVNHSTDPTRLRFKLVALPLAVVMGLFAAFAAELVEARWVGLSDQLQRRTERVRARLDAQLQTSADGSPVRDLTSLYLPPDVSLVLFRPSPHGAHSPDWQALYTAPGVDLAEVNAIEAREEAWRAVGLATMPTFAHLPESERVDAARAALRAGDSSRWSLSTDGILFLGAIEPSGGGFVGWPWETPDGTYFVGFPEEARRGTLHIDALRLATALAAVALALLLGLPLLFRASVLTPVAKLLAGVQRVERGDLTGRIDVRTNDELGRLAQAFDAMVTSIREARESLERVNRAAFRFVPREFVRTLGHESIVDVQLGDETARTMTVMFADIRSFTTLCESMTPEETFAFVNALLARLGPAVRRHGGFIDKYLGDAVMALFDGGAENALAAAIDMRAALAEFNAERVAAGEEPIRIGIGLHRGDLMLGIVGEEERIDGTVLADAVNIASRLEGLTKRYGATIVTSRETLDALPADHGFDLRLLERVRIKGREAPLEVHEVFSGDDAESLAAKRRTRDGLATVVSSICDDRFDEALASLAELRRASPDDPVVGLHFTRMTQFVAEGPPPDWDGAHRMDTK